jgi:hypothetical protein
MTPRTYFGLATAAAVLVSVTSVPAFADTPTTASAPPVANGLTALGDNEPLLLPVPIGTKDEFAFETRTIFWSVIAISPDNRKGDVNLEIYDDADHKTLLKDSTRGSTQTDFVAIDSNHRPLGAYYARAYLKNETGIGNYRIEYAQGESIFDENAEQIPMAATDLVTVRDTFLLAGHTYQISAAPSTQEQDPSLFLMWSRPKTENTWYRSRNNAVMAASAGIAGVTETITFTPEVSDWYGVVLVYEAGDGTYTLQRTEG